ncbi:MAG TPA: type II secretion system F family protein, partial [bacterium]|nr:type II secretion system F family protein [bacterium]
MVSFVNAVVARLLPPAPLSPSGRAGPLTPAWPWGRRTGSPADTAMLTYDLAVLLGAGLPLLQALEVLAQQTTDAGMRGVLRNLSREIQEG